MKIVLIRHLKTTGNKKGRYIGRTDESLCEDGIQELDAAAYPPVQMVFTSPMKRCMETAALIYPELEGIRISGLRECDFGDFEDKNYLELSENPDYQIWIDSGGSLPFPHGESREQFQARSVEAFDRSIEHLILKGISCAAFVVHGGTIMAILDSYSCPHGDYFTWQTENGGGYKAVLSEMMWRRGKKSIDNLHELPYGSGFLNRKKINRSDKREDTR